MFIGRSAELSLLSQCMQKETNDFVVLYGRKGVGKTELLKHCFQNEKVIYYHAKDCSEREQLFCMNQEMKEWLPDEYVVAEENLDYRTLLSQVMKSKEEKRILILDEFHWMIKNSPQLLVALNELFEQSDTRFMIILCSSSVNWVEQEMVSSLGALARRITVFLKLKEFPFLEVVEFFQNYTVEECIAIYAILGGIPAYLVQWDEKLDFRTNMEQLFFQKEAPFYEEAQHFLKNELRELQVYNTILLSLANGRNKLNDIYQRTGFSRAKISVYIKNLIALDIVQKDFSFETGGYENVQKGIYSIKDPFLRFWYCFVMPNQSKLEWSGFASLYQTIIWPQLEDFIGNAFVKVCIEFLQLMNQYHKLPIEFERFGNWYGKKGTIDFLAQNTNKEILLGKCYWMEHLVGESEWDQLQELIEEAKIKPCHIYLFAKRGFDPFLVHKSKADGNLTLIELKDL